MSSMFLSRGLAAACVFPFSLLVSGVAPAASWPDQPGIYPNRDYVNQTAGEFIDPYNGNLQLHHVDVFVPGNGGFDLKVLRSYNAQRNGEVDSPFGRGWQIHFGRLLEGPNPSCTGMTKMTFETPDGNQQVLYRSNGVASTSTTTDFLSHSFWRAKCNTSTGKVTVFSTDGLGHEMTVDDGGGRWLTGKLVDRHGLEMDLTYQVMPSGRKAVKSITNQEGRTVTFNYGTNALSSITFAGRSWSYNVSGSQLLSYQPPTGGAWTYNYYTGSGADAYSIRTVSRPQGATTTYAYQTVQFMPGSTAPSLQAIRTKSMSFEGASHLWTYSFTQGSSYDETTIDLPSSISSSNIKYRHFGLSSVSSGEVWKVGLLIAKIVGGDQTETYQWGSDAISNEDNVRPGVSVSDTDIRRPRMTSKQVVRGGSTYTSTFSGFDSVSGQPTSISENGPGSRSRSLTYFNSTSRWIIGKLESESIGGFQVLDRGYNTFGDVELEEKFGLSVSFNYTSGNMTSRSDGVGTISYSSYSFGIPQTESRPGATISRGVDSYGNVTSESDGLYNWTFGYDGLNRITRVTPPTGSQVNINWTDTSKTVTRGGFTESTQFDDLGNAKTITREGVSRTLKYDVLGRKVSESLPGASTQKTDTTYDLVNRVKTVSSPAGNRSYSYSGSSTTVTNERGNATTFSYDRYGDPDQEYLTGINRGVVNTSIDRDSVGRMQSVTQSGVTRCFSYVSGTNLVSQISEAETGTTSFTYHPSGALKTKTWGGITLTYGVDGMSRTTSIQRGAEGTVTFEYFANGKLKEISEPYANSNRQFTYDANGNLTQDRLAIGAEVFIVGYSYDSLDGLSSIVYPRNKGTVTLSPDSQGRPTAASPYVTSISYRNSGNLSSMTYGNGKVTAFGESSRQVPDSVSSSGAIGLDYTYDGVNNVTSIGDSVTGQGRSFGYDSADRLTSASSTAWGGGSSISYDGRGNIDSQTLGPSTLNYTYSGSRLASLSGRVSRVYGYDSRGNVDQIGSRAFVHDAMGQLACVGCGTDPANLQTQYRYDGQARRVSAIRDGRTTYYFQATNGDLLFEYTPFAQAWSQHVYVHGKRVATRTGSDATETQTTVSVSPANPTSATPMTITATVAPSAATGTVEFSVGGNALGSASISGGQASITASLPIGTHSIGASYGGSFTHAPSNGSANVTVQKGTASVALSSSPAAPTAATAAVVSATVMPSTATGTVTFNRDGSPVATVNVVNGVASLPATPYAAGSYEFTASYSGNGNLFGAAASPYTVTVAKAATVMPALTSPTPKVIQGGSAVISASVQGSGYFPPTGSVTFYEGPTALQSVAIANGMAVLDITTLAPGVHSITASYPGDANHQAATAAATSIEIVKRVASDANFDGKSDFFYRNDVTGEVYSFLANGTSVASFISTHTEPNTAWRVVADGDFNGDGVADLLFRNATTGQISLVTLNALGVAVAAQPFFTEPDLAWRVIHAPDLNGDGRADILWWNSSTGQVFGMLMAGTTIIGQGHIAVEPDTNWRIVGVGDFSGSGKQNQLLWRNRATGQVWMTTVTYASGAFSATGQQVYLESNLDWKIVATADFNGDGKGDMLYRNSVTGQIWMIFMNGTAILTQGPAHTEPNLDWKVAAVGDYNGDGKADLLWRNEATGDLWTMLMDGNAQLSAGQPYVEPNLAWKLLGPWEYGNASGVLQ